MQQQLALVAQFWYFHLRPWLGPIILDYIEPFFCKHHEACRDFSGAQGVNLTNMDAKQCCHGVLPKLAALQLKNDIILEHPKLRNFFSRAAALWHERSKGLDNLQCQFVTITAITIYIYIHLTTNTDHLHENCFPPWPQSQVVPMISCRSWR